MRVQRLTRAVIGCVAIVLGAAYAQESTKGKPSAKVMELDSAGRRELTLLSGPPETVTMRSGLVSLEPNQSVGKHSTKGNEEMLVVLEGKGKMVFNDGSELAVEANHVLYCPPQTEHNVVNTGTGTLRYVYIVAKAE
ncbi:MAG: cupin domain-containing protein [Acidobacteriia bacterium]|nr:cupin domain-containing protein [Terriglobia bacterium]